MQTGNAASKLKQGAPKLRRENGEKEKNREFAPGAKRRQKESNGGLWAPSRNKT